MLATLAFLRRNLRDFVVLAGIAALAALAIYVSSLKGAVDKAEVKTAAAVEVAKVETTRAVVEHRAATINDRRATRAQVTATQTREATDAVLAADPDDAPGVYLDGLRRLRDEPSEGAACGGPCS